MELLILTTINDIMFSPVNKPAQRWGLLIDRYTNRIAFYQKGLGLAHYDADLTTVIVVGDLPSTMTRTNCNDFCYVNGKITHQPEGSC